MSVFNRLTNTGGGTSTAATSPSVYNRLVPTQASTTGGSSVYERLTKKPAVAQPTPAPVKIETPFAATPAGIAVATVQGIPKAVVDVYKAGQGFATDIIQGINRQVASVGVTAGNAIPEVINKYTNRKVDVPFAQSQETANNPISNIVFGGKPVKTIQQQAVDVNEFLKPYVGEKPASLSSYPLVGLGIALDLSGFGGGKVAKLAVGEIPEQFFKVVAKDASEASQLKRLIGIGMDEANAAKLAPDLAKAKTVSEAKKVVTEFKPVEIPVPSQAISPKGLSQADTLLPTESTTPLQRRLQVPATKTEVPNVSQDIVSSPKPIPTQVEVNTADVEKYIKEQIAIQEAARSKGLGTGIKNTATNFYKEVKKKLVDFAAPIEDTLRVGLKEAKMSMLPGGDITNQIDRVLKTPTMAGQFVRDNGLETVIKNAPDLNKLDQYMIAKQAIDVDTRGINTGRNLAMDKRVIQELGPTYDAFAKQVTEYSQKILDYSVESGLIDPKVAEMLKKRFPSYVPLNRVFSEMEKTGGEFGSKAIGSISRQTVVTKLKGSDRAVESPIRSLLEKTVDAFKQGERNKAAAMLASYRKIPGNPFGLRELKKGETAAHTISFLDNGVKRTFETTKDIAEAAKALNVQQLNILGRIFALPVRVAKLGITGINLPFIARNIAKDQVTAAINSNYALKTSIANPAVFLKSLFEAVNHGSVYDEMIRNGAMGTSFDIARNNAPVTVERLRAGAKLSSKIKYSITHPSELLRAAEDIIGRSEELTRIQQYVGTKKGALAKGVGEEYAQIEASRAARENTVNFARRGEWGQVLNSAFLYLNAGIQGSRTFVRNLKNKPIQTATKLALTVFTPVAISTAWNLSDPKRKEAYDDIADYEKQNNIIIIPENPTKNADGTWNVMKIPLSQEANNLARMISRSIEAAHGEDPVSVMDIASALIGSVSPVTPTKESVLSTLVPQAVKPSVESAVNRSLFTGLPIVPTSMEKLSPELQYKPYTSGTVRAFGKATKLSPLKIEAFLKGTFGGVAPQAINLVDQAAAGLDIIPRDQIGGQNIVKAIIGSFAEARGGKSGQLDTKLSELITKQADDSFRLKTEAESLYNAMQTLDPKEAAAKFEEISKTNPKLAKEIATTATDTKMGLSYADRTIKTLGVTNGARATYIVSELNDLKTIEEKKAKYQEYIDKKIITKDVANQIASLLNKAK